MPQLKPIRFRRGNSALWQSVNPVLDDGEPGYERDTQKFKIGDGSTPWNSLAYASASADLSQALKNISDLTPTSNDVLQFVSGQWRNRTMADLKSAMGLDKVSNSSDDTKNTTAATLKNKSISGSDNTLSNVSTDSLVDGGNSKVYTAAERQKLGTIQQGATANASNDALTDRANHHGTQPGSSLSDGTVGLAKLDSSTQDKVNGAVQATMIEAKGDLLVGNGDNTLVRIPAGGTGKYLRYNPSVAGGLEAALPPVALGSLMRPTSKTPYPLSDVANWSLNQTDPAYSGQFYWSYNGVGGTAPGNQHFRVGGKLVDNAGVGFNQINGAAGPLAISGYEFEFYVSGDRFSVMTFSYGNHDFQIIVDDMPFYPAGGGTTPLHMPSTAGQYFMNLQFATSRVRKVRILMGQTGLVQVLTPSTGYCWPAGPRLKVAVIADSYWHGNGGSSEGAITALTMAGQLAMQTGWEVWNLAEGGTGYSNPGNGTTSSPGPNGLDYYGAAARLAALAALPAMDLILVWGGANDGALNVYPVANTIGRANALWNAIKAARPNTPLIVGGIESGVYPAINPDLNTLNSALKAAALANGNVTAYVDQRNPLWVSGTGNVGSIVGDGNADLFVSTDLVHPTHAGWEYITSRAVGELAKVLIPAPAMA